jgi:hypothetical protein
VNKYAPISEETQDAATEMQKEACDPEASRTTRWLGGSLSWVELHLGSSGDYVWRTLRARPLIGVTTASIIGFGLAATFGATELAFAGAVGYAAYQILQRHEAPSKAVEEIAKRVL